MSAESEPSGHNLAITLGVAAGVLATGVLVYRAIRPEKDYDAGENVYDIIANLDDFVVNEVGPNVRYALVGGPVAYAIGHSQSELTDAKGIILPGNIFKSQYREKTHTRCDLDLVVESTDENVIEGFRRALVPDEEVLLNGSPDEKAYELSKPGSKLKIGVTGLVKAEEYFKQPQTVSDRLKQALASDWVSHRLEDSQGKRFVALSNVVTELPDDYFEQWNLIFRDGQYIPTLHPLIIALCYASRPGHGIRARDVPKVEDIMSKVGDRFAASLVWGDNQETVYMVLGRPVNPGIKAAAQFVRQKNQLRWANTREDLGAPAAALLAAKFAIHRKVDTWQFTEQFGQGGWIYDHVLSRVNGETRHSTTHSRSVA